MACFLSDIDFDKEKADQEPPLQLILPTTQQ
jgi:hypothetical protein